MPTGDFTCHFLPNRVCGAYSGFDQFQQPVQDSWPCEWQSWAYKVETVLPLGFSPLGQTEEEIKLAAICAMMQDNQPDFC
jgi:hypothetical protein